VPVIVKDGADRADDADGKREKSLSCKHGPQRIEAWLNDS
jgi:hypothetical protein